MGTSGQFQTSQLLCLRKINYLEPDAVLVIPELKSTSGRYFSSATQQPPTHFLSLRIFLISTFNINRDYTMSSEVSNSPH